MYERKILGRILEALTDTPVVFIKGARQTGKSTLAEIISRHHHKAHYVSLDNAVALSAARLDPTGFVQELQKPVIIDEIQRVPELILAIKEDVDQNRKPGRYLLTGSANVLTLPRVSDSLAGRMEVITLWPLSRGEFLGKRGNFIDQIFSGVSIEEFPSEPGKDSLHQLISAGGYPEPLGRGTEKRKAAWFDSYIMTLLERDVREISNIRDLAALPRFLQLLAARSSATLNQSELSRSTGIPNSTLGRYMSLLESIFIIKLVPAWSANLGKRLVKSPKLYLADTGLSCHLIGFDKTRLQDDPVQAGKILENFVVAELLKQASWSDQMVKMYHFRTQIGQEVDIILEDRAGRIVGIEVKLAATATAKDLKGLMMLRDTMGEYFTCGVLFYSGSHPVPFGDRLFVLPLPALYV